MEKLTITITGPQGSGKTRWATLIQEIAASRPDLPAPEIVDEGSAGSRGTKS